jgi:hypothetical protein
MGSLGSGILAPRSICSLYFELRIRYISKCQKIGKKNSHVHLHVLHVHKVVTRQIDV